MLTTAFNYVVMNFHSYSHSISKSISSSSSSEDDSSRPGGSSPNHAAGVHATGLEGCDDDEAAAGWDGCDDEEAAALNPDDPDAADSRGGGVD